MPQTTNTSLLQEDIHQLINTRQYAGRMEEADGYAAIRGACGDDMEYFIEVENRTLKKIKFYTNGCYHTWACATLTSHLSFDKDIHTVLQISAQQIIQGLPSLPTDHYHCAVLAVSTLYKAIADYWLRH